MCGIAGIISLNTKLVNKDRLKKMTDALAHRGPDGEGYWVNETSTTGLGHRRLAIIDLSVNGAQPMHFAGRYTITYNGEIYNYIELKATLSAKGYAFTSHSDTEVILAAYDCWKEDSLQYFDGMFSFAIWDEQQQKLFAARDRFGEKPFYYWYNGEQLLFSSEIKALWEAGVEKHINKKMLFNFITLGYTQNPSDVSETAFAEIYKLPAASFFTWSVHVQKNITPVKYWTLNRRQVDNTITEAAAIDKFKELFFQSVQKRLRSDVTVGTSLSGGLDSSSIAAIIQQLQLSGPLLQTFSAVFPGSKADESAYIKLLSEKKRIENFTVQPTAESFINDFEKLYYYQEGFIGSASIYAQYKVFELAQQHNIKVLLDGQGADETLAGYHKYFAWYWQELYRTNKQLLKKEIISAKHLGLQEEWNWKNKLVATLPGFAGAFLKKSRDRKQRRHDDLKADFVNHYGGSSYQLPAQDQLTNILYYNTFENGLEELLQYADRNSMAHGCEVRLPFLNHQLVEFIFSLPSSFKIKDGRTKWILRKSMEDVLPAAIVWRKDKIGFEPPQKEWMGNPVFQEYLRQAKRKLVEAGVLKKQVLDKKIQPHDAHAADSFDWRYLAAARLF